MGLSLQIYFLFGMVCKVAIGDEQHCSKYHYEAQTLERIIRAEISLETVKNDIQHIKEGMEKVKMKTVEHKSELEEKLELMQHTIENVMINITKTNDKEGLTTESSMRQFCTTNTTCSDVEDSECKWMMCKCKPGLSYHHGTRKCLSDCGDYGYGNTYQVEIDALLYGFATKTFNSISLKDCIQKCTTEGSIICRSAEYNKNSQICYLSWETLHTNPSDHRKDRREYVIYTRDCNSH
ncbi:uncharacterized protein LOC123548746 [Mercenaria mercenaria]|uniref:uncharacterized protein LOC123548746 n=1 Tax=Mercenaria mercenaria TaxID=6596 RepID=UPI001E1DA019|nr:uncharacterized protein LOC123548746 [Mercenaria mercenaria]